MRQKYLFLFNKKKRGITDKLIMEIGGLVFGAVLILLVTYWIIGFTGLLGTDPEGLATRTNLNALANEIEKLLSDNREFSAKDGFPLNMEEEYILVGFDREWNDTAITDDAISDSHDSNTGDEAVSKPSECGGKACLCIYENVKGMDFDYNKKKSNKIVYCKTFEEEITFLGHRDNGFWNKEPENEGKKREVKNNIFGKKYEEYEYLFIYGRYAEWIHEDYIWKVRNVYTEKTVDENNNTFIFIARDSDYTKKRYNDLRALAEFNRFTDKIGNCRNNMLTTSTYSEYPPYFVDKECSCGNIALSLPENYAIKIDNNAKKISLSSEPGSTQVKIMNVEISIGFEEKKGEQKFTTLRDEMVLEGSKQYYITKQDDIIVLGNEKGEVDECKEIMDEQEKQLFIAESFMETYERSNAFLYEPEEACIINRFSFEEFPRIATAGTIKLDNEEAAEPLEDFCYINISLGLKPVSYDNVIVEIDSELGSKAEFYENEEPKRYRPSKYLTFYLGLDDDYNKKRCFDPPGRPARKEYGSIWPRNRCRYKDVDAGPFQNFIEYYNKCSKNATECGSFDIILEDNHGLEIAGQNKYLKLFFYDRIINETELGPLCIATSIVPVGPPDLYWDGDVARIELRGSKTFSFEKVNGKICLLI